MNLSPEQAAESLSAVKDVQVRSNILRGYERSAPHFFIWGAAWMAGYGLTQVVPAQAWAIWIVVILLAYGAGFLIGNHKAVRDRWRVLGAILTFNALVVGTVLIFHPSQAMIGPRVGAFIPLLIAAIYVTVGLWSGTRFVAAGVALAALTLIGWFLLPYQFSLWMAVVGGGVLMLTGVWMRRA